LCFFNISPDPCPKLAKNDFNRDEKRKKTEGFENISFFFESGLNMSDILSTPG
jgi:hypothetical protein